MNADSLILGPVTLREATATLRVLPTGAEITGLDAALLGGRVHGSGTLRAVGSNQEKPSYTLEGKFERLKPAAVGQLLGLRFSGAGLDAEGKIELSGFTDKDLADSVQGTLNFDWRYGTVSLPAGAPRRNGSESPAALAKTASIPPALAHFDRWTAQAEIANGMIALKKNQVQRGSHKQAVEATLTLGNPPKVAFAAPTEKKP